MRQQEPSGGYVGPLAGLVALALFGCSSPHSVTQTKPVQKKAAKPDPPMVIDSRGVDATCFGPKNEVLWILHCVQATITMPAAGGGQPKYGAMTGVNGTINQNGKPACDFSSKRGDADHEKKILILNDHVRVVSKNPASILTCDTLVYDGNNKFFKARGHVAVQGTMRTVGTLDEVWATPDLKRVASPDLFPLPMKQLLILPLAFVGSLAPAQVWTDGKGLVAKYQKFKMERSPNQGYVFAMVGNVLVTSEPQGLSLSSATMNVETVPDKLNPKANVVQHAVAKGKVIVLKRVDTKAGKQTTQIDAATAEYTAGVNESLVKMSGKVKIQSFDASQHPEMVATGDSGVATLEPLKQSKTENGLRKATLDGSTKLLLTQIDPKTKKTSIIKTSSDHTLLENIGKDRKITLTGAVHIEGAEVGTMSNIERAVFLIKDNGDIQLETSKAK